MMVAFVLRSLVLLLAACVAAAGAHRRSASARALILTAALAGLVALPIASGLLPVWRVELPRWAAAPAARFSAIVEAPAATPIAATDRTLSPASHRSATTRGIAAAIAPTPRVMTLDASASSAPAGESRWPAWPTIAFALWAVVATVLLARVLLSHIRLGRWSRRAEAVQDVRWHAMVDAVRRELRIRRDVAVRMTDQTDVPLVAGIRESVLILPADADDWEDATRLDVLRHELAHVARHDAIGQLLGAVACATHWFNPLVWAASRWAAALRERACDDVVIGAGTRASVYASRLIELVSRAAGAAPQPAALAMAGSSRLRGRVTSLLDARTRRGAVGARATIVSFVVMAMAVVAIGAIEPVKAAESPATTPGIGPIAAVAGVPAGQGTAHASSTTSKPAQAASVPGFCSGNLSDSSSSIDDNGNDRKWTVKLRGTDCTLDLHAQGQIDFNDDFTDVARLSAGGSFTIDATDHGVRRQLDIRTSEGALTHDYTQNGQTHGWDADAQHWFSSFLIALDRRTAIGVDIRLPHLLKQGGVGAVLDETAQMPSDYARSVYYKKLMDTRTLSADERRRVLEQAADLTKSDYYASELLKQVIAQGQLTDARERAAVVSMIEHMKSDYYQTEAMKAIGAKALSADQLSALLKVTAGMQSDYYKYEMVKFLIEGADVSGADRATVIDAVGSIKSDYYAGEALKLAVSRGLVGAGDSKVLTAAIGRMKSDNYVAGALTLLMASRAPEDLIVTTTLDASARISSAYYRGEVLNTLVSDRRLSEKQLLRVIDLARVAGGDYYAAETMVKALRNDGVTERVRSAARTAAASMSQYYGDEVRRAADRVSRER